MTLAAATALSVKDILLKAALAAPAGRIDEPVHVGTNLGMFLTSDYRKAQMGFADVPVDRVVALGRDDFLNGEQHTWRTVVGALTCEGWTDKVLDYFEAPLLEAYFPAPSSLGELKLGCLGGLCQVSCGNHRLVAGRAWLTAQYGDAAVWRQAKVQYEPLTPSGREMLSRAAEANTGLRVALFNDQDSVLTVEDELIHRLAALSSDPTRVYAMGNDKAFPLSLPRHFWLHRQFSWNWLGKLRWLEIPAYLVNRLLDDEWITTQLP